LSYILFKRILDEFSVLTLPLIMFSKTIAAILLTSLWLGALAAPAGQVAERGCRGPRKAACLREVDGDVAENPLDNIIG